MTYPGGKNGAGVYQTIINLIPPHDTYIEPFLGSGTIMRLKRHATVNIGIDKSEGAIKSFTNQNGGVTGITLLNDDALWFLNHYTFSGREFVYCDPPYVHSTRIKTNMYTHEMDDSNHKLLLSILKILPCMVMISGYESDLYSDLLSDWNKTSFMAMTRGGKQAKECLWYNYSQPIELHDYRYLGKDYRERERIKRKKQRWVKKLQNMPLLERQALLSSIDEAWPAATANNDDHRGTPIKMVRTAS